MEKVIAMYKKALDYSQTGFHSINAHGETIWFNQKMKQLKGQALFDHRLESDLNHFIYEVLKTKAPILNYKRTYWTTTGEEIVTMTDVLPVYEDDVFIGVLEVARDITERTYLQYQPLKRYGEPLYFETITAISEKMQHAKEKAKLAANNHMPVLLYGEAGAGKDMIAEAIHHASNRPLEQFAIVMCRHNDAKLLELVQKLLKQRVQTLFCEQIEQLSLETQQKLYEIVTKSTGNCQFIASIGADPIHLIAEGKLSKDLYYFFSTISIYIPALRERKEDILPFIEDYFERYRGQTGSKLEKISSRVEELLVTYDWPGNLKELEILLDEAVLSVTTEKELGVDHLPMHFRWKVQQPNQQQRAFRIEGKQDIRPLVDVLKQFEETYVKDALALYEGNISKTAEALGVSRQSLQYRLKRLEEK